MNVRRVLLVLAGVVALLGAAVAFVLASFDSQRYKPELAAWVKARTGRELSIDGPLRLKFLPRPGIETGRLALSERDGAGTFASVAGARLSLALWPLLRGETVISDAKLESPQLELFVRRDGTRNFDDLIGTNGADAGNGRPGGAPGGSARRAVLDGLQIVGGTVHWRDERSGTDVRVHDVEARIGRLERGKPGDATLRGRLVGEQPRADLALQASGRYRWETEGALALTRLDARVSGTFGERRGEASLKGDVEVDPAQSVLGVRDFRFDARTEEGLEATVLAPKLRLAREGAASEQATANVHLDDGHRTFDAKLVLSALLAKGERIEFENVSLDGRLKATDAVYEASLAGPVTLDLGASAVDLPALSGTLRLATSALGREPVVAPVSGSLRGRWTGGGSGSMQLRTTLEGSAVQASVDLEDWSERRGRFALVADRLDLDRYLPPPAAAGAKASGGGAQGGGGAAPAPATAQRSLIDRARLQQLDVAGTARIGSLVVRGLKVEKLDLGVRARDGRIDIQPLAAALYGGTTSGRASLDVASRRWRLAQQLNGVQAGPFLRAAARLDRVEGRGNATVDLEATGLTAEALVRSLRGTARLQLADGAVKGVDLTELLRQASIALGSKSALEREGRAGDRTAFSELAASFVIRDGVATTQDLVFRSEAAKASGGGRLDLVARTVDYRLDATLLGVSADIRNRVIARIGEVSVPVRITGPMESPKYSVDLAGFAAAAAANELNRRLQGGNDGRKDPVGDLLRGLFGK